MSDDADKVGWLVDTFNETAIAAVRRNSIIFVRLAVTAKETSGLVEC